MIIPLAKAALLVELRIYWLNLCERVLSITLTCIWCWGISFLVLRNMEYSFITITPWSTLTLSGGGCYVLTYGLNRPVWKLFELYLRLVFFFFVLFLIQELVGAKQDRLIPSTDETLAVVRDKLAADPLLEERTCIPIDNLMEMLTFCVETTYFGMGSDIYRQEEGLAMGSPLSPVLANLYMGYFEEMALGSTSLKPSMWLRYVDDTFILWPHQEDVQILLDHMNSIRPSIQFTMEKEQEQITLPRCISNTHRARIQVICVP